MNGKFSKSFDNENKNLKYVEIIYIFFIWDQDGKDANYLVNVWLDNYFTELERFFTFSCLYLIFNERVPLHSSGETEKWWHETGW